MTDEIMWMKSVRRSYILSVSLMALQYGFTLAEAPADPSADPENVRDGQDQGRDDESCLFVLTDQSTGKAYPRRGATLGEIEDYLLNRLGARVPTV